MHSALLERPPVLSLAPDSLASLGELDANSLSDLWGVFTKCKDNLQNGRRLENLSWRLWFDSGRRESKLFHVDPSSLTNTTTTSSSTSTSDRFEQTTSVTDPSKSTSAAAAALIAAHPLNKTTRGSQRTWSTSTGTSSSTREEGEARVVREGWSDPEWTEATDTESEDEQSSPPPPLPLPGVPAPVNSQHPSPHLPNSSSRSSSSLSSSPSMSSRQNGQSSEHDVAATPTMTKQAMFTKGPSPPPSSETGEHVQDLNLLNDITPLSATLTVSHRPRPSQGSTREWRTPSTISGGSLQRLFTGLTTLPAITAPTMKAKSKVDISPPPTTSLNADGSGIIATPAEIGVLSSAPPLLPLSSMASSSSTPTSSNVMQTTPPRNKVDAPTQTTPSSSHRPSPISRSPVLSRQMSSSGGAHATAAKFNSTTVANPSSSSTTPKASTSKLLPASSSSTISSIVATRSNNKNSGGTAEVGGGGGGGGMRPPGMTRQRSSQNRVVTIAPDTIDNTKSTTYHHSQPSLARQISSTTRLSKGGKVGGGGGGGEGGAGINVGGGNGIMIGGGGGGGVHGRGNSNVNVTAVSTVGSMSEPRSLVKGFDTTAFETTRPPTQGSIAPPPTPAVLANIELAPSPPRSGSKASNSASAATPSVAAGEPGLSRNTTTSKADTVKLNGTPNGASIKNTSTTHSAATNKKKKLFFISSPQSDESDEGEGDDDQEEQETDEERQQEQAVGKGRGGSGGARRQAQKRETLMDEDDDGGRTWVDHSAVVAPPPSSRNTVMVESAPTKGVGGKNADAYASTSAPLSVQAAKPSRPNGTGPQGDDDDDEEWDDEDDDDEDDSEDESSGWGSEYSTESDIEATTRSSQKATTAAAAPPNTTPMFAKRATTHQSNHAQGGDGSGGSGAGGNEGRNGHGRHGGNGEGELRPRPAGLLSQLFQPSLLLEEGDRRHSTVDLSTKHQQADLPLVTRRTSVEGPLKGLHTSKSAGNVLLTRNKSFLKGAPVGTEMDSSSEEGEEDSDEFEDEDEDQQTRVAGRTNETSKNAIAAALARHQLSQQQQQQQQRQRLEAAGPIAPPQTPRTTRRAMLATELSESLRRNLLWERQTRNSALGAAPAGGRPFVTPIANTVSKASEAGNADANNGARRGNGGGGGVKQQRSFVVKGSETGSTVPPRSDTVLGLQSKGTVGVTHGQQLTGAMNDTLHAPYPSPSFHEPLKRRHTTGTGLYLAAQTGNLERGFSGNSTDSSEENSEDEGENATPVRDPYVSAFAHGDRVW